MSRRIAVCSLLFLGSPGFAASPEFSAAYTVDILNAVSGGLSSGSEYVDNLDLQLEIDLHDRPGGASGRVLIYGLYNNAANFSADRLGDLQVVSNIDADESLRLFEAWYELSGANWSLKTGLYDLNSEFDVNEAGGIFLNSSHGIGADFGQTGRNGPSIFPVSSLALRAAMSIDRVTARAAVLDGVPGDPADPASNRIRLGGDDGVLGVYEVDVSYAESARLWLGYWRYTAAFDRVDGGAAGRGNDGWYLGTETEFQLGSRRAKGFLRYGVADDRFNVLSSYTGAGLVVVAPFKRRPGDQLGVAVASARAGDPFREFALADGVRPSRRETIWELTYRIRINEHFVVQPDVQFVRNPSLTPGAEDAWVIGCRIKLGT